MISDFGLVSIIVPIYNSASFLRRALCSVQNQTYPYFQCILVNDGSTDNSLNICEEFVKKDKRFTLLNLSQNSGVSVARNVGLSHVKGKFIFWLDSDDYFEKNLLEQVLSILNSTQSDVVIFNVYVESKLNRRVHKLSGGSRFLSHEEIDFGLAEDKTLTSWLHNKACKSFVFDNVRFNPEHQILEDYAIMPSILAESFKVYYLDEVLYHYVINESSLVHTFCPKKELQMIGRRLERMSSFYGRDTLFWAARRSLLYSVTAMFIAYWKARQKGDIDYRTSKEFLQLLKRQIRSFPLQNLPQDTLVDSVLKFLVSGCNVRITYVLYSLMRPIRNFIKKLI